MRSISGPATCFCIYIFLIVCCWNCKLAEIHIVRLFFFTSFLALSDSIYIYSFVHRMSVARSQLRFENLLCHNNWFVRSVGLLFEWIIATVFLCSGLFFFAHSEHIIFREQLNILNEQEMSNVTNNNKTENWLSFAIAWIDFT